MKTIRYAAIAALLSTSMFTTPALSAPVTPEFTQASDVSPVLESDMAAYCSAQRPDTLFDAIHDRFTVDADTPAAGDSTVTGDTHNIGFRPDTTSSFVYAQFLRADDPLTRTGGSVNMWGQSVFGQKIWDNTLYDVETRFEHTVTYAWACNYENYQVVDHEWEWDNPDNLDLSGCTQPAFPTAGTCTVTVESEEPHSLGLITVPGLNGGGGSGGAASGGSTGGSNPHDVDGADLGDGDSGCGLSSTGTNTDPHPGSSDQTCPDQGGGGSTDNCGVSGTGSPGNPDCNKDNEPETVEVTGHWNAISDWVANGSASTSVTHTIDDGYYTTETDLQQPGHVEGVNYTETGQYTPAGVRSLACINPGKKGGTWTPKNNYSGVNCNTTYFNSAVTAYGTTFDTITGVLPSASLPAGQ